MILSSLTIQGFKSFDKAQTLDFSGNAKGLYFLTGDNKVQPSLGANGAGKTSVLDALCWVLFEKTTRGLKAKNIKNWNGKEKVVVQLDFESRFGSKIKLIRTWSPNSLKWSKNSADLETITQDDLESEIGLNYDTFIQTIIIPQFASMFFDKKPTEQAALLTEILDIKEWMQYSDYTKGLLSEQKSRADDVRSTLDRIEGQLFQLSDTTLLTEKEEWEVRHSEKIRSQKAQISNLKLRLVEIENDVPEASDTTDLKDQKVKLSEALEEMREARHQCRQDEDKCSETIEIINSDIGKVNKQVQSVKTEISNAATQIRMYRQQIAKIETLKLEGICPTCGQSVDEQHIADEISPITSQIEEVEKSISELNTKLKAFEDEKSAFEEELAEATQIKKSIKDELKDFDLKIENKEKEYYAVRQAISEAALILKNHLQKVETAKNSVSEAARKLEEMELEINPYIAQLERNAERRSLLNDQKVENSEALKEALEECTMLEYWVKHFKNIRTYCISQALMQLQVEVNTNLARLGLADWSIHFDIERETSSNTVKKEFQILIQSPGNEGLVPWESWSGGESQRLRIAGTTGLASLILSRKGITTNVEFWDEPTNGLNQAGVEDLMATLSEHAKDNQKQVWVVDHRSLSFGSFKKSVCVTKDVDGSSLEVIES